MFGTRDDSEVVVEGVVTSVEQIQHWKPSQRQQIARVAVEGREPLNVVGREPVEFFLRKPRAHPVDAYAVAILRRGDEVRITHARNTGHVTSLTIVAKGDTAGIRPSIEDMPWMRTGDGVTDATG